MISKKQVSDYKQNINVSILSIVANALLIAIKAVAGILGQSYALIADSVHSLSDLVSDIIVIAGIKMSNIPKDKNHPYGHGKIENYTAHVVGIILTVIGILTGISAAKAIYFHTGETIPGKIALIAAGISIVVKEALYRITIKIGKKTKSQSIIANAWHHRSDALSSIAALIGVGYAILYPKMAIVDECMGLLIAVLVMRIGLSISWNALKSMIDTAPSTDVCDRIINESSKIDGVIEAHDLRARYYSNSIFVDIHITVDPDISVKEGHDIAENVEHYLKSNFEDIVDITIHIDPNDEQTNSS